MFFWFLKVLVDALQYCTTLQCIVKQSSIACMSAGVRPTSAMKHDEEACRAVHNSYFECFVKHFSIIGNSFRQTLLLHYATEKGHSSSSGKIHATSRTFSHLWVGECKGPNWTLCTHCHSPCNPFCLRTFFIWIILTRFYNSNILHHIIHLFSVLKQAINSVTTNVILLKFMRSVKTK